MTTRIMMGLEQALSKNPNLANEGIPFDEVNTVKAHPLHRICDGAFAGRYTNEEAAEMAKIFLEYGADVNGNAVDVKQDTPLIAAASLNADPVAILYIDRGANIHHAGCAGGTALHWAVYCGRDKVVKRLIEEGGEINKRCIDYQATPLLWAMHGLKDRRNGNGNNRFECIKILIQAGADKSIPNGSGEIATDYLIEEDVELKRILNS